jgi:peroxiredoxin
MKKITVFMLVGMFLLSGLASAGKDEGLYNQKLTLRLTNGSDMKLSDLSGKPSIVFFYNSICGCRPYRELLNKVYLSYKDKGVQVIGVGIRESADTFLSFAKGEGFSFPSGFDATTEIAKNCKAYSVPVTVFLSKDGQIARKATGYLKEEEIRAEVEKLL